MSPEMVFEVYCSCGNGLCNQTRVETKGSRNRVTIEPCEKCLDNAKEEGDTAGYDRGLAVARDAQP